MNTTTKLFLSFLFCCLTLFLLGGCSFQSNAQNTRNRHSADVETVKKDLQEISDYAEARDYNVWVIPTRKNPEHINVDRFMNMRRATNLAVWERTAERKVPEGQILLGLRYLHGMGISADEAVGVNYLGQAAEQGYMDAQFNYGTCFAKGIGVPKDDEEAKKWFSKASEQLSKVAEQGDAKAQMRLGKCHLEGVGVSKDEAMGALWIQKAAEQGNADAQFLLGMCYLDGVGVPTDEEEAEKWFHKAEEQRQKDATAALKKIAEGRIAKQQQIAEEKRIAEERRLAEERRVAEEKRIAEERQLAEEAEKTRLAAEAEAARRAEEKRIAEEKQKALRMIILAGAADLNEELQRSGFRDNRPFNNQLFDLLQHGNVQLRDKLNAAERNLSNADAFDRPDIQRQIDGIRAERRVVIEEIAEKTFLTEYNYSISDVRFDENRNEGSCTITSRTGFSHRSVDRNVGGSLFPILFPMPDVTVTGRDLRHSQMVLSISGSADHIRELVRNSGNYSVRVRFKNLRNTWNNQGGQWADIERIEIIDKAKEMAVLANVSLDDLNNMVDEYTKKRLTLAEQENPNMETDEASGNESFLEQYTGIELPIGYLATESSGRNTRTMQQNAQPRQAPTGERIQQGIQIYNAVRRFL